MNTIYKNAPTYKKMYEQALDIHSKQHPVQKEIEKSLGSITFTAEITEDKATLDILKHIPGVCAFLCTLKTKDNIIFSEGRGVSVINGVSKYISRNLLFARNASLIDAIVRSTKYLEVLNLDTNNNPNSGIKLDESYQVKMIKNSDDGISDKQRDYLMTLIRTTIADTNKRSQLEKQIPNYSKNEASELIKSLVK